MNTSLALAGQFPPDALWMFGVPRLGKVSRY